MLHRGAAQVRAFTYLSQPETLNSDGSRFEMNYTKILRAQQTRHSAVEWLCVVSRLRHVQSMCCSLESMIKTGDPVSSLTGQSRDVFHSDNNCHGREQLLNNFDTRYPSDSNKLVTGCASRFASIPCRENFNEDVSRAMSIFAALRYFEA